MAAETSRDATSAPASERRQRFGSYFPRLFAFAQAMLADESAAREVVIESFTAVFPETTLRDDEFEAVLFRVARELCRTRPAARRTDDGLNAREREVVSLVFDGQLPRPRVATLLGIKEDTLAPLLVRALKKLRARSLASSAVAPAA